MLEDLSFLPELPTIALFASLLHIFFRFAYLTVETCSCSFSDVLNVLRLLSFDIYVTMHCDKFLIIKPTRCTSFSNLFLEWNSTCFAQFLCPSSGVFHCTRSNVICCTGLVTAASRIRMEHPDLAHNHHHYLKLYIFQTGPLSIIRSFSLYMQQWYMSYTFADSCQQTCITYTIAVCTVKNSW